MKFLMVGSLNTFINYSIFIFSYKILHLHYITAGFMGVSVACITGFFMNRAWTFSQAVPIISGGLKYLLIQSLCIITHLGILTLATREFHITPYISQILGIGVTMCMNFGFSRYFVFSENP